jgi:hypothetical protein
MPELSATATIDLWEGAEQLPPLERALALASAAPSTAGADDELAKLPLGRRDGRLLGLHRAVAGPLLEATTPCPACGEEVEFSVDVDTLLDEGNAAVSPTPIEADGYVVEWRPLDSDDVAAAAAGSDAAAAEATLLSRCVTAAHGADGDVEATAVPPSVREALSKALAAADPLAEVLVDIGCAACGATFVADLDVGRLVWDEIRGRAERFLYEVDILARAYGWTEREVLELSEGRRAAYLALALEAGS